MINFFWRLIAKLLARPAIADWLIARAKLTPYQHIMSADGQTRSPGDTARLNHGEYHRIDQVSPGGVFTLFITSKWRGDWGFLVNGVKVPWRTYTGTDN